MLLLLSNNTLIVSLYCLNLSDSLAQVARQTQKQRAHRIRTISAEIVTWVEKC